MQVAISKIAGWIRERLLARRRAKEEARGAAAVKIQAIFRGHLVRKQAKARALLRARALRLQQLAREEALREQHKLVVQENMDVQRATGARPPPEQWRPGIELAAPSVEMLWELLTSGGSGHINTQLDATELLNSYAEARRTGLTKELYDALVAETVRGKRHVEEPEDIWPRQAAVIVAHYKDNQAKAEATRAELLELVDDVYDPCGELVSGYEDLGIDRDTHLNLKVFKRVFRALSSLTCLDQSWIVAHLSWCATGEFELPPDMGKQMLHILFTKVALPLRFSQTDFYRLCYLFEVIDNKGRKGIRTNTLPVVYTRTLVRMPDLVVRRIQLRPQAFGTEEMQVEKGREQRNCTVGWTEFSILLQALYAALPKGLFKSPLAMCLEGLARAQRTKAEQAAARVVDAFRGAGDGRGTFGGGGGSRGTFGSSKELNRGGTFAHFGRGGGAGLEESGSVALSSAEHDEASLDDAFGREEEGLRPRMRQAGDREEEDDSLTEDMRMTLSVRASEPE